MTTDTILIPPDLYMLIFHGPLLRRVSRNRRRRWGTKINPWCGSKPLHIVYGDDARDAIKYAMVPWLGGTVANNTPATNSGWQERTPQQILDDFNAAVAEINRLEPRPPVHLDLTSWG